LNINGLFELANQGDKAAEKELFRVLSVRFRIIGLQRIWNKSDIDDIVQDALKTVVEELKNVTITSSFSAWAAKILDYKILAYIKKKRTTHSRISNTPPDENYHSAQRVSSDLKLQLMYCLKQLFKARPMYARILNLHYQGFSVDEVCQRLEITRGNSYVILSRARLLLSKCLNEKSEEIS